MNWLENLLILVGISLDIFAASEVEGSMLGQVKGRILVLAALLVAFLQLGILFVGYYFSKEAVQLNMLEDGVKAGSMIAIVIFIFLGVRLFKKAVSSEIVLEHKSKITIKYYLRHIGLDSIYTFFTGVACGLVCDTNIWVMVAIIMISCFAVVVFGTITGYRLGFGSKSKLYGLGAIMLWVAAVEILLRNVLHVFA